MNRQTRQIVGTGAVFAGTVVMVDLFLTQIPALAWLALGLIFFLAATSILSLVAHTVPDLKLRSTTGRVSRDEFQHLVDIVDAGIFRHDKGALRIVLDRLRSLALGTVAAHLGLSKKEILELAQNKPQSLRTIVDDENLVKLLTTEPSQTEGLTGTGLEKVLRSVERWSK